MTSPNSSRSCKAVKAMSSARSRRKIRSLTSRSSADQRQTISSPSSRRSRSEAFRKRSASITFPVGLRTMSRYNLTPRPQRKLADAEQNAHWIRQLAETLVLLDITRYQIGCIVIHSLDRVTDLIKLYRRRDDICTHITNTNEGFSDQCRIQLMEALQDAELDAGPPSTGTPKVGSIANFTREELVILGIDFSTRPSALELDGAMAKYWRKHHGNPIEAL
ncbi:hypothetical protein NMY22_g979 [Coprinellus aureogranulatus]|nr:hypothetical protein NMY22_g979 [Coprinellus aureogranulatus]